MGKVVTSQGLQDFVSSGKFEQVTDHKPGKAPEVKVEAKPEVKAEEPKIETKDPEPKQAELNTENEGWEDFTEEERKILGERATAKFNKKHRAMKEAQEAAAENERFAEQQFNERRLAEKRAQEAEDRAKALEAQVAPKAVEPELKEPSETDPKYVKDGQFDWKAYSKDVAKFEAAQAVADERKKQADERAAAERNELEARVKASADVARKAHSDYDQVISSVKGTPADQVPQYVLNYLLESPNAGEVAYFLAKNPEESARISKLKPILGLAELGKLEDRLTKPVAPAKAAEPVVVARSERGGAPAPITPLNGEGVSGVVTDPSKMDFKQLRAYERARRAKH
jgi:hypothetical protein